MGHRTGYYYYAPTPTLFVSPTRCIGSILVPQQVTLPSGYRSWDCATSERRARQRMHPAPNLAEAPPKSDERPRQHSPASPDNANSHAVSNGTLEHHGHPDPTSPPVRKDTTSSTSTTATAATLATLGSNESAATTYSTETSPSFANQAVFHVKDGNEVTAQRRPSRRRTGPLSNLQRERAALIRKLGACSDCRRRRVAVSSGPPKLLIKVPGAYTKAGSHPVPPQSSQHDLGGSG